MIRPRIFGTNWKMNKTSGEAAEYAATLRELLVQMDCPSSVQVFIVPPYTSIAAAREASEGKFWIGAQNMHWDESGPYTGEISAAMLSELGVDLVQLGHAERRAMFNETDLLINRKVHAALRAGFRPLVCIGETLMDREFKVERETCVRQLRIALKDVPVPAAGRIIIAYEPAWAIGEGSIAADGLYIRAMNELFRSVLEDLFGSDSAERIPVLYGGSVNPCEAAGVLTTSGVDGLFVGRAALDPVAFASLIRSCLPGAATRS
jgi:L-erythrulose 1-phosphate isomerase